MWNSARDQESPPDASAGGEPSPPSAAAAAATLGRMTQPTPDRKQDSQVSCNTTSVIHKMWGVQGLSVLYAGAACRHICHGKGVPLGATLPHQSSHNPPLEKRPILQPPSPNHNSTQARPHLCPSTRSTSSGPSASQPSPVSSRAGKGSRRAAAAAARASLSSLSPLSAGTPHGQQVTGSKSQAPPTRHKGQSPLPHSVLD